MSDGAGVIGTTLAGKYLVKRLLGEGGMGAVYEAEHVELGKRVAVKVIHPVYAGSDDVAARFRLEARAASLVESESIVQVFDVGGDAAVGLYMVMELLSGEDLAQRLERESMLDVGLAVSVGAQAARALAKAHAAGVIHRDLKPANLFLVPGDDGAPKVKLLDFGISKLLRRDDAPVDAQALPRAKQTALTRAGVVLGTAQYMSPEQAQGLPVDGRTDVWSLGAVLFEALAGRPAFAERDTYEQTIIQLVTQRPPRLSDVAPWVPKDLTTLVDEALTPEVDARLPDCEAFAARLASVASRIASGAPSAIAAVEPASESAARRSPGATGEGVAVGSLAPRRGATRALIGALFVLGLVAFGGVFLAHPRPTPPSSPSFGLVSPASLAPLPSAEGQAANVTAAAAPALSAVSREVTAPATSVTASARVVRPLSAPPHPTAPATGGHAQIGGLGTTKDY